MKKSTQSPIVKNTVRQLTMSARDLFNQVGIHRQKTIGRSVHITQNARLGVSFEFCDDREPRKEYHIPARMVKECIV